MAEQILAHLIVQGVELVRAVESEDRDTALALQQDGLGHWGSLAGRLQQEAESYPQRCLASRGQATIRAGRGLLYF